MVPRDQHEGIAEEVAYEGERKTHVKDTKDKLPFGCCRRGRL